jgi:hypothetical protein
MPTTFTSLILFVLLITPGAIYVMRRQKELPHQERSALRETLWVSVSGLLFSLTAGAVIFIISWIWPSQIIDFGALIADPQSYLSNHWRRAGILFLGMLGAASALAWAFSRGSRALHVSDASSWEMLFKLWREKAEESASGDIEVRIDCVLDDESSIGGRLYDYNPSTHENGDRDLILGHPIRYRPAGGTESESFEGVQMASVSASRIRIMFVTWLDTGLNPASEEEEEEEEAAAEAAEAAVEAQVAERSQEEGVR